MTTLARTIQHPGVEIRETDLSQIAPGFDQTTFLVMGFAERGEDELPIKWTSRNAFLSYYGEPKTDAEKYFYYAAENVLAEGGNLITAKLPYDNDVAGKYRYQGFYVSDETVLSGTTSDFAPVTGLFNDANAGVKRIHHRGTSSDMTQAELDEIRTTLSFPAAWSTNYGFIIVNTARDVCEEDDLNRESLGIFTMVIPAFNALAYQGLAGNFSADQTDPYSKWA
jgi:hypothetical protein